MKPKTNLVKQICRCGCQGCYYENEKECPDKECSASEEEYIFVEKTGNVKKPVEKKIVAEKSKNPVKKSNIDKKGKLF